MHKLGFLFPILMIIFSSCTSTQRREDFGITQGHIGYIPAKISVLNCLQWPKQATPFGVVNVDSKEYNQLCDKLDDFVIEGFKDQPFMKGYTPNAVNKLLSKGDKTTHLSKIPALWAQGGKKCEQCSNPLSYYLEVVQPKPQWIQWLNQLSKATRYSDAILMPIFLTLKKEQIDDRGLLTAQNSAHIALLLIDTNNGKLIWTNQRSAEISNKALRQNQKVFPDYPKWDKIDPILFSATIWEGFPGRQTF